MNYVTNVLMEWLWRLAHSEGHRRRLWGKLRNSRHLSVDLEEAVLLLLRLPVTEAGVRIRCRSRRHLFRFEKSEQLPLDCARH